MVLQQFQPTAPIATVPTYSTRTILLTWTSICDKSLHEKRNLQQFCSVGVLYQQFSPVNFVVGIIKICSDVSSASFGTLRTSKFSRENGIGKKWVWYRCNRGNRLDLEIKHAASKCAEVESWGTKTTASINSGARQTSTKESRVAGQQASCLS